MSTCDVCGNGIRQGEIHIALTRTVQAETIPGLIEVADSTTRSKYHEACEPQS